MLRTGTNSGILHRAVAAAVGAAVALLLIGSAAFALSLVPRDIPDDQDLPRVVTDLPALSATDVSPTLHTVSPAAPSAQAPASSPGTARRPAQSTGAKPTGRPPKAAKPSGDSDDHEVVAPPVHESDGNEPPETDVRGD